MQRTWVRNACGAWIAVAIFVIIFSIAAVFGPERVWPQPAKGILSPKTSCVVPAEEIEVLAAALQAGGAIPRVLVTGTETGKINLDTLNAQLAAREQGIPSDVRKDFLEKNKRACVIKSFTGVSNLRFISESEHDQMFRSDVVAGWRQFHKKYGRDAEILWLSRVGFNPKRTLALFQVSGGIGPMAGSRFLYVFERKDGKWVLKSYIQAWAT